MFFWQLKLLQLMYSSVALACPRPQRQSFCLYDCRLILYACSASSLTERRYARPLMIVSAERKISPIKKWSFHLVLTSYCLLGT